MSTIIEVKDLSKSYTISHEGRESYTALRDVVAKNAKKIFSFPKKINSTRNITKEQFWALKDVNFEVQQGDRVGIIGRNGAGKSTLLKVLSRIVEPTLGTIKIKGRVASLLEVGTGFHPELTGRENIFLNGAILGMSRADIKKHFDAIVDFAETEKFLDTPVKRYSSGMYVRLAFAVAAHLEPEILIVDEVLAVGDAQFQKKCMGKMEDVSKNEGRTVIFVSHNMAAIESLCGDGIFLENGTVKEFGVISKVVNNYLLKYSSDKAFFSSESTSEKSSNQNITLLKAYVSNAAEANSLISVNSPTDITFHIINNSKGNVISVGYDLLSIKSDIIFSSINQFECLINKEVKLTSKIPANFLNDGFYSVRFYVHTASMALLFEKDDVLTFEVNDVPRENGYLGKINGFLRPKLLWEAAVE